MPPHPDPAALQRRCNSALPVLGVALLLTTAGAISPGGFPNSLTGPVRGWRSWNVRAQPPSHPAAGLPAAA